jgi:hypothetical protein
MVTLSEKAKALIEAVRTAQHNVTRTLYEWQHADRRPEMERRRDAAEDALGAYIAELEARPVPACVACGEPAPSRFDADGAPLCERHFQHLMSVAEDTWEKGRALTAPAGG